MAGRARARRATAGGVGGGGALFLFPHKERRMVHDTIIIIIIIIISPSCPKRTNSFSLITPEVPPETPSFLLPSSPSMTDRAPRDQQARGTMKSHQGQRQEQMRLQREAMERKALVGQFCQAISEAEQARASTPWPALAARAYDKLQYDLPLVDAAELRALLHAFR
jgi:hypothetical protein